MAGIDGHPIAQPTGTGKQRLRATGSAFREIRFAKRETRAGQAARGNPAGSSIMVRADPPRSIASNAREKASAGAS